MEAKRILVRPFNSLAFSSSSGAFYTDDTSGNKKKDDRIPYGFTKTVQWSIPEEFAPRDDDPNCLPMAYHSHNLPGLEINAGLIGLIIVCKPGNLTQKHAHAIYGPRSDKMGLMAKIKN